LRVVDNLWGKEGLEKKGREGREKQNNPPRGTKKKGKQLRG